MSLAYSTILLTLALAVGMSVAMSVGFRFGTRKFHREGDDAKAGTGTVEGAVFALFGLLIAFNFSGAAGRLNERRELIIDEANAIGTAWLRMDVLPTDTKLSIRGMMSEYLDLRIKTHRQMADWDAATKLNDQASAIQEKIWSTTLTATTADTRTQVSTLTIPALNEMFDIANTRFMISRFHTPKIIYLFSGLLALFAAYLAGYAMSRKQGHPIVHMSIFVLIVSCTFYITLDMEYPRMGLINLDSADESLIVLQKQLEK